MIWICHGAACSNTINVTMLSEANLEVRNYKSYEPSRE